MNFGELIYDVSRTDRWDEIPAILRLAMSEEKKVGYSRFVWIDPYELDEIRRRVLDAGKLDCEVPEDPDETGEPYRLVRHYSLPDGGWAEIFFSDAAGTEMKDIRLTVLVDPEEEIAFRAEVGLGEKTLEEEMGDTCSATLSPYMLMAVDRLLG